MRSKIYRNVDELAEDFDPDSEEFIYGRAPFDNNHEICGIRLNLDEKRVCEVRFPNIYTSDIPKGLLDAITIREIPIDKRKEEYDRKFHARTNDILNIAKKRINKKLTFNTKWAYNQTKRKGD